MRIFDQIDSAGKNLDACVLTIGNFDGIHQGHQEILRELTSQSKKLGVPAVLLTFYPHPRTILGSPVKTLQSREQKREVLEALGVHILIEQPFNEFMRQVSAEEFVDFYLVKKLKPKAMLVGHDFRFGNQGRGDFHLLKDKAVQWGFDLSQIPPLKSGNEIISSSLIRSILDRRGEVKRAAGLLGRNYRISGLVTRGAGMGRKLGFPTANLAYRDQLVPKRGVYISQVKFEGKLYPSITNIGYAPTVQSGKNYLALETHLFDWDKDLYEKPIEVIFYERMRDEVKFSSIDELKTQIFQDIDQAREFFSHLSEISKD